MKVSITLDNTDTRKAIANLQAKFPQVIRRSLDRAAVSGVAAAAKAIAADTGLPSRAVKKALVVTRVGNSGIQIEASRKRIPLINFGARGPEPSRGKGRGVSYRLPGGRGRAPNAFIAAMPSGHRGVYRRAGRGRVPIYELFGPSIGHVFDKFFDLVQTAAQDSLEKNLQHEISYALKR